MQHVIAFGMKDRGRSRGRKEGGEGGGGGGKASKGMKRKRRCEYERGGEIKLKEGRREGGERDIQPQRRGEKEEKDN